MNELSYIYDFLSIALEDTTIEKQTNKIILYGSIAKETNDKESDIDLFFDIKDKEKTTKIEEAIREKIKTFEIKAEKTWNLKKIKHPISSIAGQLNDDEWKNLKEEIASCGIILYGNYQEPPKNLKHYHLYTYTLNSLERKEKMKFIRKIQGYTLKKNNKQYTQKGILSETQGKKISTNTIMIPTKESPKIKQLLNKHKIKHKISEIWIRN
jgi:predicted nucleotidyltransferase